MQAFARGYVPEIALENHAVICGATKSGTLFAMEFCSVTEYPRGERVEVYGADGAIVVDQVLDPPVVFYRGDQDPKGTPLPCPVRPRRLEAQLDHGRLPGFHRRHPHGARARSRPAAGEVHDPPDRGRLRVDQARGARDRDRIARACGDLNRRIEPMQTRHLRTRIVEARNRARAPRHPRSDGGEHQRAGGDDAIAITPSGIPYGDTTPDDIVVCTLSDGEVVEGTCMPSSELATASRGLRRTARRPARSCTRIRPTRRRSRCCASRSRRCTTSSRGWAPARCPSSTTRPTAPQELAQNAFAGTHRQHQGAAARQPRHAGARQRPGRSRAERARARDPRGHVLAGARRRLAVILSDEEIGNVMERHKRYGQPAG